MDATSETPVTPGQLLAEARERQGLSRAEVAQRLHMSPSQVEALEAGDYARLPKGTFLRGFVRNYAKLLGLEAETLVAGLAQAAPAHGAPQIIVPSQNIRFEPLHERISGSPYWKGGVIAAVVLALGAAALYWFTEIRNAPPAPTATAPAPAPAKPASQQLAVAPLPAVEVPPPTEAPKVESPAPAMPPATNAPEAKKPEPAKAEPKNPQPVKAEPKEAEVTTQASKPSEPPKVAEAAKPSEPQKATPVSNTVAPAGAARLAFRFRGDSWVEVKDASGRTLFSRLNTAGSEAQVSGKPPLTVIVGNAPDVTLRYNDREFPLEPHTKVAVARFTVE